jgi:hypothetical protein
LTDVVSGVTIFMNFLEEFLPAKTHCFVIYLMDLGDSYRNRSVLFVYYKNGLHLRIYEP